MSAVLASSNYERQVYELLRMWVLYRRRWRPDNGLPSAVAWIDRIDGPVDAWTDGDDYDAKIYAATMRHVDEAIKLELSTAMQHAIYVVYLNEAGPAVWRSAKKPMVEIRRLCDEAERALVPILRRRDVVY